jgi:predicted  nucleic acid-binding Zn-ribbon protein
MNSIETYLEKHYFLFFFYFVVEPILVYLCVSFGFLGMEDIKQILEVLKSNAMRARDSIQVLEEENAHLQQLLKESREEMGKDRLEIDNLRNQIEMMKIAGVVDSDESNKSSKQKIAELVREIDYCITLLK